MKGLRPRTYSLKLCSYGAEVERLFDLKFRFLLNNEHWVSSDSIASIGHKSNAFTEAFIIRIHCW